MIFDTINNIKKYPQISEEIADFILGLSSTIQLGRIVLSEDGLTYANVDEYITKEHSACKLEAHRKYVDIQLLLEGIEELDYIGLQGLEIQQEYDVTRDVMFFQPTEKVLNKVVLDAGKFVLLYPHEAHQPQMAYKNTPSKVKKVVVKIPVA